MRYPHISEVVKYTNVSFETDESVLFIKVSLIQRYPYRERFHCRIDVLWSLISAHHVNLPLVHEDTNTQEKRKEKFVFFKQ